jgi:3-hydroxy acid dehydrogenase / malonic semialdehyde reductase
VGLMRHALVVGASSGIGAAVAQTLVRSGWHVTAAARRLDVLTDLAKPLGTACDPVEFDVTAPSSMDRLVRHIHEGGRGLDALINCAGHDIGGRTVFGLANIDDVVSVINTNVVGLLRLTHAMLPLLADATPADVVIIGSVNGVRPEAGLVAHSAAKSAAHGFAVALRDECADSGVRVT